MALLVSRRRRVWRLSLVAVALFIGYLVATRLSKHVAKQTTPNSTPRVSQLVRYSEDIPEPLPEKSNATRASGCFVFVTRTASLTKVRRTMFDVEKRFNERHAYPYVFLSEQPFTEAFQRTVRRMTSARVHFGQIDTHQWRYPRWIDQGRAENAAQMWADANDASTDTTGWRHMVRYWAGPVALHPLVSPFKYMWRLEPGSHYTCDLDYDPFRLMHDQGVSYGFAVSLEAMPDTVPTLWASALEFIHSSKGAPPHNNSLGWLVHSSRKHQPYYYNRCEFLSNFELVDLDFMRSDAYQQLFGFLDRKGGIYYERWTDASIRSLSVAMLLEPDKVRWFDDVGYRHDLWHNCPAAKDKQMRCHCDPAKSTHLLPMSCSARWKTNAANIPWDTL